MEIHELNTKSMTNPAYCALDDGADTYKLDLNAVLDTMDTSIQADIAAVDTKAGQKTRIWYASVSAQTGTPSITISGYNPGDNDYLMLLFQFGNTSIKDVHIGIATYEIWYKGANTAVKADGGERVLYRIRTKNVVPYRLEYVGNHYDLATTSVKGLMSAADKAALDQAVSDIATAQGDISDINTALSGKANTSGEYPDFVAGLSDGLNTDSGTTVTEPYNLKPSGGNGREKLKRIVGVSVGWKQAIGSLETNGNTNRSTKSYNSTTQVATITPTDYTSAAVGLFFSGYGIVVGHKYFESAVINPGKAAPSRMGSSDHLIAVGSLTANTDNNVAVVYEATNTVACVFVDVTSWTNETYDLSKVMLCDLTLMLGSTIADYVYSLETATAGAGVAWLKQHFPKMFGQYNPYDAGSIKSVEGLSAHVMRNADDEIIGNYPIDDSLTLRGPLKLDANNSPYADGDTYEADGTVERRYGEKTYDGSEEWAESSVAQNVYYLALNTTTFPQLNDPSLQMVSNRYQYAGTGSNATFLDSYSEGVGAWVNTTVPTATQRYLYVKDSSISSVADFKASLAANPLTVVFTLQTAGTETADPYTESQIVDGYGTEEFVSTSIVPVGNETFYLEDLKGKLEDLPTIPEAPTTNGTYVLKATVSGGVPTYSWVAE